MGSGVRVNMENPLMPLDYQLLFESIPGNYLVLAPDFTIVGASDAYLAVTLTQREQIIGRGLFEVFPDNPDDPTAEGVEKLSASLHRVLAFRRPDAMAIQKYDIPLPEAEGGRFVERYWSPVNAPVFGPDGKIRYLIHRVEDVTTQWRLEQLGAEQARELERLNRALEQRALDLEASNTELQASQHDLLVAKDAAEAANRAKSEFLSRMSHELRTPLNVILGFGQILQLDPMDPEQEEAVDHILKAGRHLLDLIDEILNISRIESGRLQLSMEPVHLNEVITEVVELVRPLANQRGITLHAETADWQVCVHADRQRLKQVLLNLLSNGLKYNSEHGSLTVSCADHGQTIRLLVTDTGPGITREGQSRLFKPFDRLGAEATEVEGTGLGLSLSKRLTEAMGGTIGVQSRVGHGSTFWVELPRAQVESAPAPLPAVRIVRPTTKASRHKVLYIEDNLANIAVVERVFARRPHIELIPALQGQVGLDLAREHRPALIFLDLHLPDMPGFDVLQALKEHPATVAIPVVVASADATPAQISRLLAAGAANYLTKPLDIRELLATVDELDKADDPQ